jgi:hypothetical protein
LLHVGLDTGGKITALLDQRSIHKMKNPFGDQKIPGSYHNLQERMYKKVLANVNEQILGILQKAYENALHEENVALSRPERNRLFSQIVKMVMEDLVKKLDPPSAKNG